MRRTFCFIMILSIGLLFVSSCVSSKKYKQAVREKSYLDSLNLVANNTNAYLKGKIKSLEKDTADCNSEVRGLIEQFNNLSSSSSENEKRLTKELDSLQKSMAEYEIHLHDKDLKVKELQANLYKKDSLARLILDKVSEALVNFDENELTVERKGGRVYVSLSEQLLFRSGSATLNQKGKQALAKLAQVLNADDKINVYIEGHTDSLPIHTGKFADNWDLSVLRATSVIRVLVKNYKVDAKKLSAGGQADNIPVAANKTKEGRELNRRTEIILTPKLDELFEIIEEK
jgi:chemotaxis protein MotB